MKKQTTKIMAALLAVITLLLPCGMISVDAAAPVYIMGDVNGNGRIDSTDALLIQRYLVKQVSFDSTEKLVSDIDFDEKISSMDAMRVMRCVSGYSDDVVGINLNVAFENEVVRLVNIERAKEGVAPLKVDATVSKVSDIRVEELTTLFSHNRADGTTWSSLVKKYNIKYKVTGENIAAGQESPKEVVTGWMNSPGHRENIMDPIFTKIGVGHYYDPDLYYEHYWQQLFIG